MIRVLRPLRWLSQLSVLALILLAPALQIWAVSATTRWNPEELDWRYGPLAADTVELLRGAFGSPDDSLVGAVVGAPWSMSILGLELNDPIALGAMLTGGVLPGGAMLLGVGIVLAINVLLGRVFCGWFCPYGTLSRFVSRVRPALARRGLVHSWRPPQWIGLVVLAGVILAPLAGVSLAWLALPYLAVGRTAHALYFGGVAGIVGVLGALLLSDVLLWDHGVCRSICPSGALQTQLGRLRVFRLVALRTAACQKGCHACGEACWLGLDPRRGHLPSGCDACGRCIPKCPETRLAFRFTQDRVKKHAVHLALLMALLPGLNGCAGSAEAPTLTSTRVWSSEFEARLEPGHDPDILFVEDGELSVGIVQRQASEWGLRVYLLAEPETAWREALTVRIDTPGGPVEVSWDTATTPRSVPRASIYEASLEGPRPTRVTLQSGPMAGRALDLPPARPRPWSLAPVLFVGVIWGLGHLARPVLRRTP